VACVAPRAYALVPLLGDIFAIDFKSIRP
jgi:hypothetical protein